MCLDDLIHYKIEKTLLHPIFSDRKNQNSKNKDMNTYIISIPEIPTHWPNFRTSLEANDN